MEHGLPAVGRRRVDLCYATRWLSGWSPAVSRLAQHGPILGVFVAAVAALEQLVALVQRAFKTLDLLYMIGLCFAVLQIVILGCRR